MQITSKLPLCLTETMAVICPQVQRTFQLLHNIVKLPLVGMSVIVVIAMRILALACKIVGQKSAASYFRYETRKILLNVEHTLRSPRSLRLADTMNMAKSHVIWTEEDTKVSRSMRDKFAIKHAQDFPELTVKLLKSSCRAAQFDGICFGAVRCIIKDCLKANITSEDELIAVITKYEDGFDADAAGLQKIYDKTLGFRIEICNRFNTGVAYERAKIQYYNDLSELIGIRIKSLPDQIDEIHFHFDTDKADKQKLNDLPEGMYSLNIGTSNERHALAYLKFQFGSYIVDPTYGLLNPNKPPSEKLLDLFNFYNTSDFSIVAYSYTLLS